MIFNLVCFLFLFSLLCLSIYLFFISLTVFIFLYHFLSTSLMPSHSLSLSAYVNLLPSLPPIPLTTLHPSYPPIPISPLYTSYPYSLFLCLAIFIPSPTYPPSLTPHFLSCPSLYFFLPLSLFLRVAITCWRC